jgi:DNA-binding CsgD family transcriptional regulator
MAAAIRVCIALADQDLAGRMILLLSTDSEIEIVDDEGAADVILIDHAGLLVDPPMIGVAGQSDDSEIELTAREREVLALLAHGASNKSIARELAISVHTAKFHVASLLAKLGARNRSDAVAIGLRRGLVLV